MEINIEKLKQMINDLKVTVSFNGFEPFEHEVVSANKLFANLHEIADCPKEDFVRYINSGEFKNNQYMYDIFYNVKSQGMFRIKGMDAIGSDQYIELKSLKWM
jgi:hypothetical protein